MRSLVWVGFFSLGIAGGVEFGAGWPARADGLSLVVAFLLVSSSLVSFRAGGFALFLRRGGSSALRLLVVVSVTALLLGAFCGARAGRAQSRFTLDGEGVVDVDARVQVEGRVVSAVEKSPGRGGCRVRVRSTRVNGRDLEAEISLSIASGMLNKLPGDAVRVHTRLISVRGTANPDLPDTALAAHAAGIDLFAGVGSVTDVETIPTCASSTWTAQSPSMHIPPSPSSVSHGAPTSSLTTPASPMSCLPAARRFTCLGVISRVGDSVMRAAAGVRGALSAAIDRAVTGAPREFLHTAILGERQQSDPRIEEGFRAAGATHVLSVSGLHLAVIALVFFQGARVALGAVPRLPLYVDPSALAAAATIPAIWFYTAITGAAVATLRAALMMSVAFGARIVRRKSAPVAAMAIAAFILTVHSPLVVFDVSYQLSITSVLALALLLPRMGGADLEGRVRSRLARFLRGLSRWAGRLLGASMVAGGCTAPLVAHHFGEVTPAGPLGNVILVPLVESVVVPVGLAGAAAGALCGDAAGWLPLHLAAWAARGVLAVAEGFRIVAPVMLTRMPTALETVALTLGVAFAIAFVTHPRLPARRWFGILAVGCLAAGCGGLVGREIARRGSGDLVVTFLDVGQGDSAVVQMPGGRTMLIDGGGSYDGAFDPGARIVEPFLRRHGILRLDVVALSHPHPDHMGGLHRIMQRFDVGALWTSGDDGHNPDYRALKAEAAVRRIATPAPEATRFGVVDVEPLGPFVSTTSEPKRGGVGGPQRIGPPEGTSVNDASLVLRIANQRRSVLFTGDLEEAGEGELSGRAELGQVVASDVLKVPHHGSRTSSGAALLDSVRPRLAVMSLGWHNRFHFPRPEVLERYRARGIRVLRTDLDGAITLTLTAEGEMRVACERGCD